MSSKKFYSDLALAKAASFGHVSNIRRGELEDGISFLFSVEALELAVNMELVIRDITEYTKSASFMLITSYENPGEADVSKNLQALSNDIPANGTVSEILAFLSDSLLAALTTRLDEMDVSQASDFDDSSVMDQDYHDEWDDPHAATDGFGKPNTHLAEIPDNAKLGSIKAVGGQELKRALSKAKTAKLIVGLLPAEHRQFPRFISLAVRVSVLGLPSDVLEAWGLKSTEYLVLLIHFANGYPELAKYEALPEKQLDVQFRFGKCAIPKPSQQAATQAFFGTADGTQRRSTTSNDPKPNEDESTQVSAFLVNHMSAPINRQLNQDLHGLLRLRRRHRMSWSAVQKLLSHSQNDSCAEFQPMDLDEEAIINNRVPEALQVDYALDDEDQVSLPLVAMQFALRQLVRCTELCMACHEAMGEGLGSGSLKPYVCEKPLCLYQYLSLGFGPSIEHEIINNPLVVDVLVSLAYSAVISGRIRDFPLALSVTVPNLNKGNKGVQLPSYLRFRFLQGAPGKERQFAQEVEKPPNWSNAELPLTSAFSLCEVINRPRDFVSSTPHYVINRIDWVQCRYLFFPFTQAVSTAVSEWMAALKKQELDDSVPQAPEAQLFDMLSRPVLVPWQAIPPERRSQLRRKFGGAEHAEEVSYGDDGRNEWGGDDLELLVGCDSATECPRKGETEPQSPVRTPSRETKVTPYFPGTLDLSSIPKLPEPSWATSSRQALQVLNREVKDIHRIQSKTAFDELGWSVNTEAIDNIFHWIVELHSFDTSLPLGQDMMRMGVSSIVLEIRFGAGFPMSPPFVRVVRPRFLPFSKGGGGHVTMGGAICSELLTNSGWSPALSMEKVLLQVRLGLCELDPAARLDTTMQGRDYNIFEAVEAYKRAAAAHGWRVPAEIQAMTLAWLEAPAHN
ncbi:hypothetical protein PLIIFM63780_008630 [Purpureocillium lilacinum]|nr:hypothetical protein PLIIFM63780_008630 [Purpureocillium lilacinum]